MKTRPFCDVIYDIMTYLYTHDVTHDIISDYVTGLPEGSALTDVSLGTGPYH